MKICSEVSFKNGSLHEKDMNSDIKVQGLEKENLIERVEEITVTAGVA